MPVMFPFLRTLFSKMVKTGIARNWVVSQVIEEDLREYVQTGVLAKKKSSTRGFRVMELALSPKMVK